MDIIFCEACGVSIPEHQVAGVRHDARQRSLCATCSGPASGDGDLPLYFCENCRVSIPAVDVVTGLAAPEGSGYVCGVCSRATPSVRAARRIAVDREMVAAAPLDRAPVPAPPRGIPAPSPDAPRDPIYFCDGCNASIPAAHVATGRASVRGGRAVCEGCRPRVEAEARGGGVGALTIVATALLAAGVGLAAFLGVEQVRNSRAADAPDPLAGLAREVAALRSSVEQERARTASRTEVESSVATLRAGMDTQLERIREELVAAGEDRERLAALLRGGGAPGEPDRLTRIETRLASSDRDARERVEALSRDVEARLVSTVSALREELGGMAARAPEAPVAPAPDGPSPPPPTSAAVGRNIELLRDRDAGVRFSAAIELGKLGDKAAVPALAETLTRDEDVFVRRACVRSLGDLKAYEVFGRLVDVLTDAEEYVAKQAAAVLKDWCGDDFGYKQDQPKGDRKRVADRARRWWDDNKTRLAGGGM